MRSAAAAIVRFGRSIPPLRAPPDAASPDAIDGTSLSCAATGVALLAAKVIPASPAVASSRKSRRLVCFSCSPITSLPPWTKIRLLTRQRIGKRYGGLRLAREFHLIDFIHSPQKALILSQYRIQTIVRKVQSVCLR